MHNEGSGNGPSAGYAGWKASRRVILKAAATVGTIAAAGSVAQTGVQPGFAQDESSPETLARRWVESEQLGEFAAQAVDAPKIVDGEFVFYAVGAHWNGVVGYWPLIELSFSADGVTFGDPITVTASVEDGGRPNRDDRIFSHLAFTEGAQFIQYRTLDGNGVPTPVEGLALTYIDASAGPTLDDVFAPAALPTLEKPPTISRAGWGANESYRFDQFGVVWEPEYQAVEHVIIHHTVTPNFQDPLVAIRSIYYYHAIEQGWGDIGYNYLLDYSGNVYEGRHGGDNVVGGHAYQYAYGSSGVGTMGNFSIQDVTEDTQAAIIAMTAWLARNLDPLGRSDFLEAPDLPTICGHRDVNSSECPGNFLYADLPGIRQAVADVLADTESPPEEEIPPPPTGEFRTYDNVVTRRVNLRVAPSFNANVIAGLQAGTLAAVLGSGRPNEGYVWYFIRTADDEGYVAGNYLDFADPGNPPAAIFAVGDFARLTDDDVALRARPGLMQTQIAYLPAGSLLEITVDAVAANNYRWYGVYHSTYKGGWIVQDYLEPAEAPNDDFDIGDQVVVNTDVLNLRTGPGLGFSSIASMPGGTKGTVLDGPTPADGYVWWQLQTGFGAGWAAGQYLTLDDEPPPQAEFQVGDTIRVIDTDGVNLRFSPSTGANIVAALPFDTVGEVVGGPQTGNGYTWYQITTALGVGWSIADALEERDAPPPPPVVYGPGDVVAVNASTSMNMRVAPSRDARTIASLPRGTIGEVLAGPQVVGSDVWYQIATSLSAGWVLGKLLILSDEPPPPSGYDPGDIVQIQVSTRLNLRAGPSRDTRTIASIPNGTVGEILDGPVQDGFDAFYEIRTTFGNGWVLAKFLVPSTAPPPPSPGLSIGDTVVVDTDALNLRSSASTASTILATMPNGAVLEIIGGPTDSGGYTWWRVTSSSFGIGWCAEEFLREA